jgi:hypothetical protein
MFFFGLFFVSQEVRSGLFRSDLFRSDLTCVLHSRLGAKWRQGRDLSGANVPNLESGTNVPDFKSSVNVPNLESGTNILDFKSSANVPYLKSNTNVQDMQVYQTPSQVQVKAFIQQRDHAQRPYQNDPL